MMTFADEERIVRLERGLTLFKSAFALSLVGFCALVGLGQVGAPDGTIRAERFEVVDRSGKLHGWFAGTASGVTELVLLRPEDQGLREAMDTDARQGRARSGVSIAIMPDGLARIALGDREGNPRAEVLVSGTGAPSMMVHGATKATGGGLGAVGEGAPSLSFKVNGMMVVVLGGEVKDQVGVPDGAAGKLYLFDESGHVVFKAPR